MKIYMDTAAFLAILNANDQFHPAAQQSWKEVIESDSVLFSSNYVLLETTALLQHRFGIKAVRLFESDMQPIVEVVWIDELIHKRAMGALLAANRRDLSLVDCTSFDIMRQFEIDKAFTFDPHFREQGFRTVPG